MEFPSERQDAAGDARWPVWREFGGRFGWLVGEGGGPVAAAAARRPLTHHPASGR